MLKTFKIVTLMATLVVAIIFAVVNFKAVPLDFLFGKGEIPLSVLVFAVFLCGLGFGLAIDAWLMLRQRRRIRRLEREVGTARSELNNLRKLPLKDLDA